MKMAKRIMSVLLVFSMLIGESFVWKSRSVANADSVHGIRGTTQVPLAIGEVLSFGEWKYYLDENGYAIISGYENTSETSLIIPYEMNGHAVTGIGKNAFSGFSSLRIRIHSLVTSIAGDAFDQAGSVTISAYNGAYALEYAARKGIKRTNLTEQGDYTFQTHVIDFSGFSERSFTYENNSSVRVSRAIAEALEEGECVYFPENSGIRRIAGGRIARIEQYGSQNRLILDAVGDPGEVVSRIKGTAIGIPDLAGAETTEGVTIVNQTESAFGISLVSLGKASNKKSPLVADIPIKIEVSKPLLQEGNYSLEVAGTVSGRLKVTFVYDIEVGLFYIKAKDAYVDSEIELGANISITGKWKKPVELTTIPIKEPTTQTVLGSLTISFVFGIEGKVSLEWGFKANSTLGIKNGKLVNPLPSTNKSGPTISGNIKGYVKLEGEAALELGWEFCGYWLSVKFVSFKLGPLFELSATAKKELAVRDPNVGECVDLTAALKFDFTAEAGIVQARLGKKTFDPGLKVKLQVTPELWKGNLHFDNYQGGYNYSENCVLRYRKIVKYNGNTKVGETGAHAGTLVNKRDFPDQNQKGKIFDGWEFCPAESGLTGTPYLWNFSKYTLPVIPYGYNYVFRARFIDPGQSRSIPSDNQPSGGYIPSKKYSAGGGNWGGSGTYGGYYRPTLPPMPPATPTPAPTPTPVPVTSVTLNIHEAELYAGDRNRSTLQLAAALEPPTAANKDVHWTSGNEEVAYVNGSGEVMALGAGTATISCASLSNPNIKDTCIVTVHQMVTGVYLSGETDGLIPGDTVRLGSQVAPTTADNKKLIWTSSDETVASVSSEGVVTAIKAGNAVIKATAADGAGAYGEIAVNIGAPLSIAADIQQGTVYENGGEDIPLAIVYVRSASVRRMLLAGNAIEWILPDEENEYVNLRYDLVDTGYRIGDNETTVPIIEIHNMGVNKVGTRTVSIECRSGNYSATIDLPVRVADGGFADTATLQTTKYRLGENEPAMIPGRPVAVGDGEIPETMHISLEGDALFDHHAIIYSTDDGLAVVFDESGIYTANVTYQYANILYRIPLTFEAEDAAGIVHLPVQGVSLSTDILDLVQSETGQIEAAVFPADAYNKALSWSSENEEIVSVDQNGNITARAPGKARITCSAMDGSGQSASCLVRVESFLQLSDSEMKFDIYTGFETHSEIDLCSLTSLSSNRVAEADLEVAWQLSKLSGDSAEVALEQFESRTGTGVRVEGNRIHLLRINGIGTDVYRLSVQAGEYAASCDITLNVLDGSELPETLKLETESYELSVGEELEIDPSVLCVPEKSKLPENADVSLRPTNAFWNAIDFKAYTGPMTYTFAEAGTYTAYVVWGGANYRYELPVQVRVKDENGVIPVVAQEIIPSQTSVQLFVGETENLTATVEPANAQYGTVLWSSSDTSVATVSTGGKITAVGAGYSVVSVYTSLGNCVEQIAVTVEDGLSFEDAERNRTVFLDGTTRTHVLSAWLTAFSSSRLDQAPVWTLRRVNGTNLTLKAYPAETVSEEGIPIYGCNLQLYSASAEGDTVYELTASSGENSVSAMFTVTAVAREGRLPASIMADQTSFEAGIGELIRISPALTCWPEGTSLPRGTTVTLRADRDVQAVIDEKDWYVSQSLSTLSFREAGRFEMDLVYNYSNVSYTIPITFYIHDEQGNVPVHGKRLKLSASSLFLEEGNTVRLIPVFTPSDVTDQGVTWSSDDPSVATVSADGDVRAMGIGETTIICTPSDSKLAPVTCQVYVEEYMTVLTGAKNTDLYLEGEQNNDLQAIRLSEGTIKRLARDGLTPAWQLSVNGGSAAIEGKAVQDGTVFLLNTASLKKAGVTNYTVTCNAGTHTWSGDFSVSVTALGSSVPARITLAEPVVVMNVGTTKTVNFTPVCEPTGTSLPAGAITTYMGLGDFYEARSTFERNGDRVTVSFGEPGRYLLARTYTVRNLSYTALCSFNVEAETDRTHFLNASETQCMVYLGGSEGVISRITIEDAGILERFGRCLSWNGNVLIGDSAKVALKQTDSGVELRLVEADHPGVTVYRLTCAFEDVQDQVDLVIDVREARKPLPESIALSTDRISGMIGNWLTLPLGTECIPAGSALPATGDELWNFELWGGIGSDVCETVIEDGLLKVCFFESGYYSGTLTYLCGNARYEIPVFFTVCDEESVVPEPDNLTMFLLTDIETVYPEGETQIPIGRAVISPNMNQIFSGNAASYLMSLQPSWTLQILEGTAASLALSVRNANEAEILLTGMKGAGTVQYRLTCAAGGHTYSQTGSLTVADRNMPRPQPVLTVDHYETMEGEPVTIGYQPEDGVLQAAEWRLNTKDAAYTTMEEGTYSAVFYEAGEYRTTVRIRIGNLICEIPVTVTVHPQEGREKAIVMQMPAGLVSIEEESFMGSAANVIDLGSTRIRKIEAYAFANCRTLTDVYLPDTLTEIDKTAFSGSPNVMIHCAAGSAADQFAQENNIRVNYIIQ